MTLVLTRSGWPGSLRNDASLGGAVNRGKLSHLVEVSLESSRRYQGLLPRAAGGPKGNLGGSGSLGAIKTAAAGQEKSMTGAVTSTSCALPDPVAGF